MRTTFETLGPCQTDPESPDTPESGSGTSKGDTRSGKVEPKGEEKG